MSKHGGSYYTKAAKNGGCRVREGTNHTILYPPPGKSAPGNKPFMSVPRHNDMSPNVERSISKWLRALGILVVLAGMAAVVLQFV